MSQTPSNGDGNKLTLGGDSGQVTLTPRTNPNSPHPLAVNKPRTLSNKEEEEEIIKEVVRKKFRKCDEMYCNGHKFSDRQIGTNSVDPNQLFWVYTVCHSVCTF